MFDRYEQFKKDVLQMTKIDLNFYKENQMRRRIDSLATKNGCTNYEEYTRLLKQEPKKFEEFINFLTINVSEFYRNPDQWKLMEETVIPKLIKDHGNRIKIWSAACSTGDEPYSLVMAFSRHLPLSSIQVMATDIDKQVIEKAKVGLYNEKSIAGVPADLKKKHFTKIGESYQISDDIKRCVTFREHNLLKDPFLKDYDLILCRNVVIYFTEDAKATIYKNFYDSLTNHGVLFIGSTEQISSYKEIGFTRLSSFYFEKVL
ncbi:MAG: protein-glutamate O-methyltransferase CheR [Agathobacter sp.]|nr:protein-glutamate O-methyltransferase CheR [Agathobacter sp.]